MGERLYEEIWDMHLTGLCYVDIEGDKSGDAPKSKAALKSKGKMPSSSELPVPTFL